jgi:hypothetical protein
VRIERGRFLEQRESHVRVVGHRTDVGNRRVKVGTKGKYDCEQMTLIHFSGHAASQLEEVLGLPTIVAPEREPARHGRVLRV